MDTEWMSVGKCKDLSPTVFFPSDGVGVQAAQPPVRPTPTTPNVPHPGAEGGERPAFRRAASRPGA